jgi:hypothetical protein
LVLNAKGLNQQHDSLKRSAVAAFILTNVQVIYTYVYVLNFLNTPCISFNTNIKLSTALQLNDVIANDRTVLSHCGNRDYGPVRTVSQNILLPSSWCLAVP